MLGRIPIALGVVGFVTAGAVAVRIHKTHAAQTTACVRPPRDKVYRFDFALASEKSGEAATNTAYSLSLEEAHPGALMVGQNVPLQSGPGVMASPRQDVGFKIKCNYTSVGSKLLLHDDVELSSFVDAPAIGKVAVQGDAVVTPGQSTQVALVEDATHRKYRLLVTATRVL